MHSEEIDFPPNPRAIGIDNPNFTRPVDALAEIVDNAIQAYSSAPTGSDYRVHIQIYVNTGGDSGFLTVSDVGQGMTTDELRGFATYASSREDRQLQPQSADDVLSLSKFGVGGKQGGFSLGDHVGVFTKSVADRWKEFHLNAPELLDKVARNLGNPYRGTIQHFSLLDLDQLLKYGERSFPSLVRDMKSHMELSESGTIFLVRLKPSTIHEMFRIGWEEFVRDLAQIYFFHLHPQFQASNERLRSTTTSSHHSQAAAAAAVERDAVAISITLNRLGDDSLTLNLADVMSYSKKAFENEFVNKLPFQMIVPPDVISEKEHRINGIVLYFPCTRTGESKPSTHDLNSDLYHDGPVVHVCWQYRVLPEALYNNMPFFPAKRKSSLLPLGLSEKWTQRTVVYLFLEWDFPHVSNNKLKVNLSDFDSILCTNKKRLRYHPINFRSDFDSWICECGKMDFEFIYSNRIDTAVGGGGNAVFNRLSITNGALIIENKDYVKIEHDKRSYSEVGQIISFTVLNEQLTSHTNVYVGSNGYVKYHRLPKQLFGKHEETIKVSLLKFQKLLSNSSQLGKEIDEVLKLKPDKIELFKLLDNDEIVSFSSQSTVFASVPQTLLVRILHGKKECYSVPHSDNIRWLVKLTAAKTTWSIMTDNDSLFSFEGQRKKYLKFPNVIFDTSGQQSLKIEVFPYDGTEPPILESKLNLIVKQNAATQLHFREMPVIIRLGVRVPSMSFELLDADNRVIALPSTTEARLELICEDPVLKLACPPMIAVSSITNGMILKTAPYMWRISSASQQALFGAHDTDPQPKDVVLKCILHFGPFDQVLMVSSQPLQPAAVNKTYSQRGSGGGSSSSSRQLVAASATSPSTSSSSAKTSKRRQSGTGHCIESTIQLRLYPGNPARLLLHDPPQSELNLKAKDPIPKLTLWCVDSLNNRTMPIVESREQWRVTLSDEYPLSFANKLEAKSIFVRETGEVIFDKLLSTYHEPLSEKGKVIQAINLLREDGHAIGGFTPMQLTINILPDEYPCTLQLYYNNTKQLDSSSSPVKVEAGAVLDSLSVRIISDLNRVMKIPTSTTVSCYFEGTAVSSKSKKRARPQLADDGQLEPITAPKVAGPANLLIEIHLDSLDDPLTETIIMEVTPGPPKFWKIIIDPSFNTHGLQLRNSVDLQSKIKGVVLIDQFENVIAKLPKLSTMPVLVFQEQLGAKTIERFPLIANTAMAVDGEESEEEVVHFTLPPTAVLTKIPQDCQVTVTVTDGEENDFDIFRVLRTEIVSLPPSGLVLTSDTYALVAVNDHYEVSLHSFDEISDLRVVIVDDTGEMCSDRWTKKLSAELIVNDHDVLWSAAKKIVNKNPIQIDTTIKLHELKDAHNTANTVILTVDVTCYNRHHDPDQISLSQQLFIKVERLANVERLDLTFHSNGSTSMGVDDGNDDEDQDSKKQAKITVIAGESIAPLIIATITADNTPFTPSKNAFTFQLLHDQEELAEIDQIVKTESPGQLQVFMPTLQTAGEYIFRVQYTEQRENLQHLPPDCLVINNEAIIIVEASKPNKLYLDRSKGKLNEVVPQMEKENDRMIGKNIVFEVQDAFENRVNSLAAYQLTCTIIAVNYAKTRVLPFLETFDGSGIVSAVAKTDRAGDKTFVFSSLFITNGAKEPPVPDSDYILLFELKKSDHDQELLAQYPHRFAFKSRLTMSSMLAQEEAKAEAARRELARYIEAKVQMKNHENELSVMENAYDTDAELVAAIKSREMDRLQELAASIDRQIAAIERRPRRPPTIATALPSCPRNAVGYVVKLAYVADEEDAKVISWAMESFMSSLIVQTQDAATEYYQTKKRKVWAIESALPYPEPAGASSSNGRGRGEETGLPLTDLGVGQDAHYMVNLIEPVEEAHRRTIFWQALKYNILAKDLAVARDVRDRFLRANRQPPIIFTRDGERWVSSGMMDPGNRMPAQLSYVFGEREPRSSTEYLTCRRTLDDCLKAKEHLEQILALREDLNTVNVDESKRQVFAADHARRK